MTFAAVLKLIFLASVHGRLWMPLDDVHTDDDEKVYIYINVHHIVQTLKYVMCLCLFPYMIPSIFPKTDFYWKHTRKNNKIILALCSRQSFSTD